MTHTFTRFYREASPGAAGAGDTTTTTQNTPLGDLLDLNYVPPLQEGLAPDGITLLPGYQRDPFGKVAKDPNYKEPNPGAAPTGTDDKGKTAGDKGTGAEPVKEYVTEKDGLNRDGTLKEGYLREDGTDRIYKDPDYKAPLEGLNQDGTLKEGYSRDAQGNVIKDDSGTAGQEDEDETGEKYIGAVEAITGRKYEIEYPEGVHPTSPEGMAHRENVIREHAMLEFEQHLKTNDPRAYAYALHRAAGGTDEDFFGDNKGFQLPDQALMATSADMQAAVYKHELLTKGLDPSAAQILVDAATKDNTLATKADSAWKLLDKAQKDQLQLLQAQQDKANKEYTDSVAEITRSILEGIKSEMGFVVPEAQQAEFQRFALSHLRYDNGKFYIVQELSKDNRKQSLESLFFQFAKGDLTKIVTKASTTKAVQRLRLKVDAGKKGPGSGGDNDTNVGKNLPLSQILPVSGQS
jgi:hypothetical protein